MTATSTDRPAPISKVARAHCIRRLLERYGAEYSIICHGDAHGTYNRHSRLLAEGVGTLLYRTADGSRAMRLHDRGQTYYPVLKPDRQTNGEVIITYLSEVMVWHNLRKNGRKDG